VEGGEPRLELVNQGPVVGQPEAIHRAADEGGGRIGIEDVRAARRQRTGECGRAAQHGEVMN
jgi:hypothetical protein